MLSPFSRNLLLYTSNTAISLFKIQLRNSIRQKNTTQKQSKSLCKNEIKIELPKDFFYSLIFSSFAFHFNTDKPYLLVLSWVLLYKTLYQSIQKGKEKQNANKTPLKKPESLSHLLRLRKGYLDCRSESTQNFPALKE